MTLIDGFSLVRTLIYFKGHEHWRKRKETNRLVFKCVWEVIESSCTSLMLTVSWVLTCGVAVSTPILSSVTLSVFVAETDSPGVTLRLQCTIRLPCSSPQWLTVRVTAQSNKPSETWHFLLPGDSPVEFTLCVLGQNLETLPMATWSCFQSEYWL